MNAYEENQPLTETVQISACINFRETGTIGVSHIAQYFCKVVT